MKWHFKRHIECIHGKVYYYSCDQCEYKANTKWHLKIHTKCIHGKVSYYSCNQCKQKRCWNRFCRPHMQIFFHDTSNHHCFWNSSYRPHMYNFFTHEDSTHCSWNIFSFYFRIILQIFIVVETLSIRNISIFQKYDACGFIK